MFHAMHVHGFKYAHVYEARPSFTLNLLDYTRSLEIQVCIYVCYNYVRSQVSLAIHLCDCFMIIFIAKT